MNEMCRKCGGQFVLGPKWHRAQWGKSECLGFTCGRCGFTWTTPTEDSKYQPIIAPQETP